MNKEPYKFLKNNIDEADHYMMKASLKTVLQWKIIILFAVLGVILGAGFGVLNSYFNYNEKLLSPAIKANIDSFYQLEQSNKVKNANDAESFIMTLDTSVPYQKASFQYEIRTDNQEDAEVAAGLLDIRNSQDYLMTLQRITGYQGDENTLSDIFDYSASVSPNNDNGADADITYSIGYLTQEQEQQFEKYLVSTLDTFAKNHGKEFSGFSMSKINQTILSMNASEISQAQQDIQDKIELRSAEAGSSYVNLMIELTDAEVLNEDTVEMYDVYWAKLINPDFKRTISKIELLECMLIGGLVMGMLAAGCIYLATIKLFNNDGLDEETIRDLYDLQILAYAPKEIKTRPVLDAIWVGERTPLKPTPKDYISHIIAEKMKDQDVKTVCMIHADDEQHIDYLVSDIKEAGFDIVEGNLLTECNTLAKVKEVGSVIIVVALNKTSYRTLEAELHMVEDQKLHLMGVIVV